MNETGLTGRYDFRFVWGPELPYNDPTPPVAMTPEKWRAIFRDQAGLLLDPR